MRRRLYHWAAAAMTNRIPFRYGNFYDFPRMLRFEFQGEWFFACSYFSDEQDEYVEFYEVYRLPYKTEEEVEANHNYWMELKGAVKLGQIPLKSLDFDSTRRKTIDGDMFAAWLAAHSGDASNRD